MWNTWFIISDRKSTRKSTQFMNKNVILNVKVKVSDKKCKYFDRFWSPCNTWFYSKIKFPLFFIKVNLPVLAYFMFFFCNSWSSSKLNIFQSGFPTRSNKARMKCSTYSESTDQLSTTWIRSWHSQL